jgi:hypothetical protein
MTLLPYGVLLIPHREKRDRQCCSNGEAVLAQGGESHEVYEDSDLFFSKQ